jgi:hypothetical protein
MSTIIFTFLLFLVDRSLSFAPHLQRTARLESVAAFATRAAPPVTTRGASKELLELFSKQVTNELQASQLYLSASVWFSINDLVGMAAFMRGESEDERRHGLDFIDFANKRNIVSEPSILQRLWGLGFSVANTNSELFLAH